MRRKKRRFLAMLLAMAMVVQQGSTLGVLAGETEPVSETEIETELESSMPKTIAETEAEETKAPETEPETKAEETKAPEAEPETKAGETKAPETEPETKAEETKAPETVAETQTEGTAASENATETQTEAAASENATETQIETIAASENVLEAQTEETTASEIETETQTEEATVSEPVTETELQAEETTAPESETEAQTEETEETNVLESESETEALESEMVEESETEAPESVTEEAVETETATEEITESDTEQVSESETETETETETEEETETETETEEELPTEFVYKSGNMIVTATLSSPEILPAGAKFVVKKSQMSEDEKALVDESLGEEQVMAGYAVYDMYFEVDGEEVEPQGGTVSVSISYEKALTLNSVEAEADPEYKVLHLTDDASVEDVTDSVEASDGKVSEVGFTTDSFSKIVLLMALEPAKFSPEVKVSLSGDRRLTAGMFTVVLKVPGDASNKYQEKMIEAENQADGTVSFGELDLPTNWEGKYSGSADYTIYQKIGALAGVTYDSAKYTVHLDFEDGIITNKTVKKDEKDEKEQKDDTITFRNSSKKPYFTNYSLEGLLNGYNIVAFGDASTGSHTVGGVLVGGNFTDTANGNYGQGSIGPSYVKGKVDSKVPYGGENASDNTTQPLYVGPSNTVKVVEAAEGKNGRYYVLNDGGHVAKGPEILIADYDYLDFAKAKRVVVSATVGLKRGATAVTADESGVITVESGTNVTIDAAVFNSASKVNIVGETSSNNTVITVTGDVISIPALNVNGAEFVTKESSDTGASVVWNFPNATSVSWRATDPWCGHVLAPNANIYMGGSRNYSGTLVGATVTVENCEGHCYPYRGTGFDLISVAVQLEAFKTLNGAELEKGMFTFDLKEGDTVVGTATNDENGKVLFDALEYTEAGTYTYTIAESVPEEDDGFIYDDTVYTVTVTVKENGGKLDAEAVITKDQSKVEKAEFVNSKEKSAEIELEAEKTLKGGELGVDEFSFVLKEGEKIIDTDTNRADGKVVFDAIKYTEAGDHTYTIAEQIPSDADESIVYDTSVYTVVVEVAEADGKLTASVASITKNGEAVKAASFVNKVVAPVDFQIEAGKKLKGEKLKANAFTFELKEDGKILDTAKNAANGTIKFKALTFEKAGVYTYTVNEVVPKKANGYIYDPAVYTVEVTVTKADDVLTAEVTKITKDGKAAKSVQFVNDVTRVSILKVDEEGEALSGAKLVLKDADGEEVDSWTTDGKAHDITELAPGEYTLSEVEAPEGYHVSEDIPITLTEEDSPLKVTMTDEKITCALSILKVDEDGEALSGAKLVLKDADNKVVDSWTTDGKAHDITDLPEGEYTLSEIEAPEGYLVSEDISITLTEEDSPLEVTMTDKAIPETNTRSLTVTKRLRLDGISSDLGVEDASFYVALFSDDARTQRVSDIKQIKFKNSSASSVTFENLGEGTYYVGETDENGTPMGTQTGDDMIFYPEYGSEAQATLEGSNEHAIGEFTNVYMKLEEGFYLSGQIEITKKILVNGQPGESDATYYAGVFSDSAMDPSSLVALVALDLAGGTSTSVTVTDLTVGYDPDDTMTYYVAETDENGNPLDPDSVTEFEVSVDKSEVTLSADNSRQKVEITNSFTEEETETETETEAETEEKTEKTTEKTTEKETEVSEKEAPKTGDDTNYTLYLMLMALSAGTCALALGQKRRKAGRVKK